MVTRKKSAAGADANDKITALPAIPSGAALATSLAQASALPPLTTSLAQMYPQQFIDAALEIEDDAAAIEQIQTVAVATSQARSKAFGNAFSNTFTTPRQKTRPSARQLERARASLERTLMLAVRAQANAADSGGLDYGFENIVSVGIGAKRSAGQYLDQMAIVVTVARKVDAGKVFDLALVPSQIDGIATDVVIGGEPITSACNGTVRPATGGISVGNARPGSCSGTIACLVADDHGAAYLLSCNHVLALLGNAQAGDPIVQPSIADGGLVPQHVIARLTHAYPIDFRAGRSNQIDCALAQVNTNLVSVLNEFFGRIEDQPVKAIPGDQVHKCGRSTEETYSVVRQHGVSLYVSYGPALKAHFSNLIAIEQTAGTPFAWQGDSGALVLDSQNRPLGIVISTSSQWAYVMPMATILDTLHVRILTVPH
jgi:hypothetical protein